MAKHDRDPRREAAWREALAEFRTSGQSVREFCGQRRLAESAFYYWQRELLRRDAEPAAPASPAFVPVTVVASATVEVRCPSGHVVSLANADLDTLRHLFAALAPAPSC
jgi:hypothetical protein